MKKIFLFLFFNVGALFALSDDECLDMVFRDLEEVFFVQIGANDGILADPVRPLIKKYGHKNNWKGVFIEPDPLPFEMLMRNYKPYKNFYFENIAISNKEGKRMLFLERGLDVGIRNSFNKSHLIAHSIKISQRMKVLCKTFDYILDKYSILDLDFLCIDTEGHDVTILNSIDFSKIRPKVIYYESAHEDGPLKQGKKGASCLSALKGMDMCVSLEVLYTLLLEKEFYKQLPEAVKSQMKK